MTLEIRCTGCGEILFRQSPADLSEANTLIRVHPCKCARVGMLSVDDASKTVTDSCGCRPGFGGVGDGGACWCIRHAAANLRGESVVDAAPGMVSVDDACEAMEGLRRSGTATFDEAIAALRKLAGGIGGKP